MRIISSAIFLLAVVAAPTWTLQQSGVTARLRGVSAVNERVIWASGSANTILRSDDGGNTWKKLTNPTPDRLDFRDVDAVSESTAYILSIGKGTLSRIYKTKDGGATWELRYANADPDAFFDAMTFWDEMHGIAVGDSVNGAFYILRTDDGGQHWTRVPPDKLPAALPGEGAFAASGTNITVLGSNVWFATGAGPRARVLRSADRGVTWQLSETPVKSGGNVGIYSIAFRDALHGVVVGGDWSKETEAVENLAITSDGGKTWQLVSEKALSGFRSVVSYVPGSKSSFVAIGPRGSDLSTDDGRTWTPIEGPGFDTFSFAPGKPIGWAAGARGAVAKLSIDR